MALVDADLKFIYIDVGTNGRVSDGGVWAKLRMRVEDVLPTAAEEIQPAKDNDGALLHSHH